MKNIILQNNEIQESVFSEVLKINLIKTMENSFFCRLEKESISLKGYRFFVIEKYSSIAYFVSLLENAERMTEALSHDLAEVFRANKLDEIGYFAGEIKNEYKHETWRLRSLESFGVFEEDLKGTPLLDSTVQHGEIMTGISQSKDSYELIGSLLFLEIFVVYEMKNLIKAFERDLPDLFSKDSYSYDRMPFNTQEYWYGHALHDTWHYRSIEEAVLSLIESSGATEENLKSLFKGIQKTAEAKNLLYSEKLFNEMKKR